MYTKKQVDAIARLSHYEGRLGHKILLINHVESAEGVVVVLYFDTSMQDSLDYSLKAVHVPPNGQTY